MIEEVPKRELSIREQAEAAIRKEQSEKAIGLMKAKLRERAAAEAVLKGIDIQINDLEQQIADGTV